MNNKMKMSESTTIVTEQKTYKGVTAIDIRAFVETPKYTGPTGKGLWIPLDKWDEFKDMVNSVEVA